MRLLFSFCCGAAVLTAAFALRASDLPPWTQPGDLPIPAGAQSIVALDIEVPVFVGPSASSTRRGVIGPHVPLPLFELKRGGGCAGRWISIGPVAWVCQDKVQLSAAEPVPTAFRMYRESADGLPFRYFFVGRGGSASYARLTSADYGVPYQQLEPGFAVAVVEQRERGGELYARTTRNLWIPARDLVPVRPSAFHGIEIKDRPLSFGWVVNNGARLLSKPARHARTSSTLPRFQLVEVVEEKTVGRDKFYRIADDSWLDSRDVGKVSASERPEGVGAHERWIDIALGAQVLVAYEGDRPVYATLVSTGRGAQNSPFATPLGVHRIWIKMIASSMDNLEDEDASDYYSIEDVPYVQYFSRGVGLHAAFWHDKFGHVRSHGCVNLAPIDAQWLFAFTSPRLPGGWTAAMPTDFEPGTAVRVRP